MNRHDLANGNAGIDSAPTKSLFQEGPVTAESLQQRFDEIRREVECLGRVSTDLADASFTDDAKVLLEKKHEIVDRFVEQLIDSREQFQYVFKTTDGQSSSSSYYFVVESGECFRVKNRTAEDTQSLPQFRLKRGTSSVVFVSAQDMEALESKLFGEMSGMGPVQPTYEEAGEILLIEAQQLKPGVLPFEYIPCEGNSPVRIVTQDGKPYISIFAEHRVLTEQAIQMIRAMGREPKLGPAGLQFHDVHCGSTVSEVISDKTAELEEVDLNQSLNPVASNLSSEEAKDLFAKATSRGALNKMPAPEENASDVGNFGGRTRYHLIRLRKGTQEQRAFAEAFAKYISREDSDIRDFRGLLSTESCATAVLWTVAPYLYSELCQRGLSEQQAMMTVAAWGQKNYDKDSFTQNTLHLVGLEELVEWDSWSPMFVIREFNREDSPTPEEAIQDQSSIMLASYFAQKAADIMLSEEVPDS